MNRDGHAWGPSAVSQARRVHLAQPFAHWLLVIACGCLLFWSSTASLLAAWSITAPDDTYRHGYLVATICLWIGWRRCRRMGAVAVRPSMLAGAVLVCASFAWVIALRGGIQTLHQALLPCLLLLGLATAFGIRFAAHNGIAVWYLIFAIPVWSVVNGTLQHLTVAAVDALIRATGITAAVHGNFITVPAGVFEVADGCAGLRYFVIALAIGVLYGEVNDCALKDRVRIVMLAALIGLVSNWLRVYGVVLAGYLTDMQHYIVRVEHASFGWVVFAASLAVFFVLARRWGASPPTGTRHPPDRRVGPSRIDVSAVAAAAAAMAVAPALHIAMPVEQAHLDTEALVPPAVSGWVGPSQPSTSTWVPVFVGHDASAHVRFAAAGREVELFTAAYRRQEQGRELIFDRNTVAGAWPVLASGRADDGFERELLVADGDGASVIWFAYRIGDFSTGRAVLAQVYYGVATLFGAPLSRVTAVRVRCDAGDCDGARTALQAFARALALQTG